MGTTALSDSELKVMDVVWREGGETTARRIGEALADRFGYSLSATYTLIGRCIKKGAVERSEPGFVCRALVPREEVQRAETDELINKLYDGSADKLFAALLSSKKISREEIERLKKLIDDCERQA